MRRTNHADEFTDDADVSRVFRGDADRLVLLVQRLELVDSLVVPAFVVYFFGGAIASGLSKAGLKREHLRLFWMIDTAPVGIKL